MKLKVIYGILSMFICAINIKGQTLKASEIPSQLLKNADAVVRFYDSKLVIESYEKYELERHYAVTIFNEEGFKNYGKLSIYYSKLSPLKDIEATIYDASGTLIKKLRKADITDYRPDSYNETISDSRLKVIDFDKKNYTYPITIEYLIETQGQTMFVPDWDPVGAENTAIEKASFSFTHSPKVTFRKKEFNISGPQKSTLSNGNTTLLWQINNISYKEPESLSIDIQSPYVRIFTDEIQLDDAISPALTWENLSSFDYKLNANRDKLPAKTIEKVNEIVKACGNDKLKIVQKIYEHMQSQTRYQSIQLGIGGWVTIPAETVAEKGFGDCKALTNYTIALLKQAGVESYAALVNAGQSTVNQYFEMPEVPHMAFNHVICCVPMAKDTVWLECTSQQEAMGYLGDFTGNRKALLVKPFGGSLINTIHYRPQDHSQTKIYSIIVNEEGVGKLKMVRKSKGRYAEEVFAIKNKDAEDQNKWLKTELNYPDIKINVLKSSFTKAKIPMALDEFEVEINKMANKSGKRLFLKVPNMMESYGTLLVDSLRESNLYLNPCVYTSIVMDSVTVTIPSNYKLESIPKDVSEVHPFGQLKSKYEKINDQTLKYSRLLEVKGGNYDKSIFETYFKFIKKINQSDTQKTVAVLQSE